MATFYSNSTNQREVMPNIYPRDYPESPVAGNMLYHNYSDSLAGSTQPHQHPIELPIPTTIISQDSSAGGPENAYNVWRDGRSEMLSFMQSMGGQMNAVEDPQMGLRSSLNILNGQNLSLEHSNVSTMQGEGLSLSLGTQIPVPSFHYRPSSTNISFSRPHQPISGNDDLRNRNVHMTSSSCGVPNLSSFIPNSKYLKAAQQLLDEVVSVRKAFNLKGDRSQSLHTSNGTTGCIDIEGGSKSDGAPSNPQDSTANSSIELSPSERQDLQNKVMKLLAMLDEVDRRYKQYYHQMQIVVSSFDSIAGTGAAKPYTALALQTISRHFRCLRDAITSQIQATRKSLGEEESSNSKGTGISRLRYVDQQLRQQRAMQQFGMMQPHAWRPQRGLPENSVTILRAWLFEHFLHPYPKDSEKLMLARQTGLTRGQVSNWFINARVRLWKPMIEEMYKEEIGDTQVDSNSSSENPSKGQDEIRPSEDRELDLQQSPAAERSQTSQFNDSSKSNLISNVDMSVDDPYINLNLREERVNGEDSILLQEALSHHPDGGGRFMAYQMAELSRYGNGGVSLTLGLQHSENGGLPVPNAQQSFVAMRGEEIYSVAPPLETEDYEYINVGDRRYRFGSSQLVHDFVA